MSFLHNFGSTQTIMENNCKMSIKAAIRFFFILSLISTLSISGLYADNKEWLAAPKKSITAVRTAEPPRIDGELDDEAWITAPVAGEFIQYSPFSGKPSSQQTEVRILYDDDALYIGAKMFDTDPGQIFRELGQRDSDRGLNADQFSIEISPFNDGINGASFKVSASGVQTDKIPRSEGGMGGRNNTSWDAVWFSKVSIVEDGWIAEFKIPYSAIRFPKKDVQTWGINFWREIRRNREMSSWNFVNREIGTTFNHLGELKNILNVKPPLRLSLTPYVSAYAQNQTGSGDIGFTYNGGVDLKYGINESFTLDATLIPDFGQVQSDDQVLNLSPFEVKYNEKRPFFMEGTEFFSKGDIFYSRRLGGKPRGYEFADDNLGPNESVTQNPSESALINATKVSGRTKGGLGIGVFNGMTRPMKAIITDSETGSTREVETDPFTNYNMIILDQSLKNNSYISLMNTNVWRDAPKDEYYYTANVTGTDLRLQNRDRMYSLSATGILSQKYFEAEPADFGHMYQIEAGKTGGAFRLEYRLSALSDTYDPNDMGYLRRNNQFNNSLSFSYSKFEPFWKLLTSRNSISVSYEQLYEPRVFNTAELNFSTFNTFNNHWSINIRVGVNPVGEDDYYEPRNSGWFYTRGPSVDGMIWFDTDQSKRLSFGGRISNKWINSDYNQSQFSMEGGPSLRLSTRFSLSHRIEYSRRRNDIGFVSDDDETGQIFFGKRDNSTLENTFSTAFIFTADSYLSLRLRHYWSRADYDGTYYELKSDGSLTNSTYSAIHDYNYNAWNVDVVYTWRFAPGSEMSVVWKNSIYDGTNEIYYDFFDNAGHLFNSPMSNSISLKILYYLDWLYLQKRG